MTSGKDRADPFALDDFKPRQKPKKSPKAQNLEKTETAARAVQSGYRSREPGKKIDGRTLRRTGRTEQLNIRVEPAIKDRFLILSKKSQFHASGEFLEMLLDLYEDKVTRS